MQRNRLEGAATPGRAWPRLPLRAHILISFLLLFGAVALALGAVASRGSQDLVDRTVAATLSARADLAVQDLRRLEETARAAAEALAANPITRTTGEEERAAQLHTLATVLRSVPGVSAAYVGWPDGDFMLLRPIGGQGAALSAPAGAAWLAQWATAQAGARFDFLDAGLEIIERRPAADFAFDPRPRPWFVDAMETPQTIVTAPYVFFTTREPGVSAARRAESGAVAGVDLSLWDLSTRLPADQPVPSTEAAILDGRGGVLAYADTDRLAAVMAASRSDAPPGGDEALPGVAAFGSPILEALARHPVAPGESFLGPISAAGRDWLATIVPLDPRGTTFVLAAPIDEIGAGSNSVRVWILRIFALTMLLTVPLVWLAARSLARPVETVSGEIKRVAELDFSSPPPRSTSVKELAELDDAIRAMRAALGSFSTVCGTLIEEHDSGAMLGRILDAMLATGEADRGAAWLAEEDTARLRLAVVRNSSAPEGAGDGELPARIAALARPAVQTLGPGATEAGVLRAGADPLTLLCIPLRTASGRLVGALALATPGAGQAFSPALLSLADFVGRAVAAAVDRPHLIAARERARRETELILNSVMDGIHVLDREGRVQRQNPAAVAMLGWGADEILGQPSHALLHHHRPDGSPYPIADCPIHRTLADGKVRRVADDVFFGAGGVSFPVEYECSPLRDDDGAIIGAVVSFRDITERRRAQRDLRERMKELRCLYRVLELTSDASRPLGEICADVAGVLPQNLMHEALAVARIVLNGQEYRSAGWRPPVSTLVAPIAGQGVELGFVEVGYGAPCAAAEGSEDAFLPEERALVAAVAAHIGRMIHGREMGARLMQSERLNAIGQLTGGVAHDFNNLLTVIMGNAESLSESLADDARLRPLAELTVKAAERGAELANQLLAFARRQPLAPRPVDINQQIAGMDKLLRRSLGEHVEVRITQAPDLWRAMVDPGQLEDAILNLSINARDAMPEGGRLTIETANVQLDRAYAANQAEVEPGAYVLVAVSDTGVGMDAHTVERAFEPFFTTKDVGKGSGLGLSMVYGFVKQSRGHVRIYSEPGQGTTVKLYLPRADAGEAAGAEPARDVAVAPPGSERILLVEDDDMVRDHVNGLLTELGYRVVAAPNGPEALAVLRQGGDFDLLFTDVVMPGGMSGRQLAAEAHALRPGLRVLFTSGYTEDAIIHHGRLDPGVHLLQKPYRRQELAAKIRLVLDRMDGS